MKNVTFSAQEDTIARARKAAARSNRTLNELFREWLIDMSRQVKDESISSKFETIWKQTSYLRVGKKLSREEMNER